MYYTQILEVNLFASAYRLFHEDLFPIYESVYYHLDKVQFLSFNIGLLTGGDVDSLTARFVQALGEAVEHVTLLQNIQRVQETFTEVTFC